jgi:hypothetical protein
MKMLMLIFSCLLLSSCATVTKTYGPNGKQAYSLNCSGTARSWDTCFKSAGDICGASGYTVLNQTSEGISNTSLTSAGFFSSSSSARTMLIECQN